MTKTISSDLQWSYGSEQVDRFDLTELNAPNRIPRLEMTKDLVN